MKRLLLWLATSVLVLYAVLAIGYRYLSPDPAAVARESYTVYSAYLAQAGAVSAAANPGRPAALDSDAAPLVILDHTTCPMRVCLPPEIPGVGQFLGTQLAIENLRSTMLERRLDPALHYALAPGTSTVLYQQPEFSRSYGQITFSAISFDRHLTRALFYTERLCGLCGGAHFVLMHREGGVWTVEREVSNWVS